MSHEVFEFASFSDVKEQMLQSEINLSPKRLTRDIHIASKTLKINNKEHFS